MKVQWSVFKTFVDERNLPIQYIDIGAYYYAVAFDGPFKLECDIDKNPSDTTDLNDFEDDYQPSANAQINQVDIDGAITVRVKAAKRGWTYNGIGIEFKTSELGSLYSKNANGTDNSFVTIKFYDNNDNEVTTEGLLEINETTIVKTVVDFEPPFDYEVIGGTLRIESDIASTDDCRLWIVAVPDIAAEYGGSKEMISGVNLRYLLPENALSVDGRVSKYLTYDATYHTNKLRFILKHDAGLKKQIHLIIDLYRA